MGKKIFFMIVIASGIAWLSLSGGAIEKVLASGPVAAMNSINSFMDSQAINNEIPNEDLEQSILASTLRIEIRTWIIYVKGQGYTTLSSNGHSTVLEGRYLLTHNHFKLPLLDLLADDFNGELATITLYTADGNFLWRGPLTTAGVAFDDSETLLIEFLDKDGRGLFESLGVPSADFMAGEEAPVAAGSAVAQINWDQNRAFVQWTKVQVVLNEEDTPVVRLADCLIPGASGGGVFINGAHIANNWSRSTGCGKASYDEALHHSTAALNSAELLASVR